MQWMQWIKTFKRWKKFPHLFSDERKFFSAISRMRWKKNFSPLSLKFHILEIFTALISSLKFTGNSIEVSDRWHSWLWSCWHAGYDRLEPVYGRLYIKNPVNAVKKLFTAKNRKNSPHSTIKDAGALRWKKFFFTANLTLFFIKPGPGC